MNAGNKKKKAEEKKEKEKHRGWGWSKGTTTPPTEVTAEEKGSEKLSEKM